MEEIITCEQCEEEFKWRENIVERPFEYVPGVGDIYEVGITCPHCEDMSIFIAFMTRTLKKRRDKIQLILDEYQKLHNEREYVLARERLETFQKKMIDYRKGFDKLNKEMSKRFNRKLPVEHAESARRMLGL